MTLGELCDQLVRKIIHEPCRHPPHEVGLFVPTTIIPDCLKMTLAEAIRDVFTKEAIGTIEFVRHTFCPTPNDPNHLATECVGCVVGNLLEQRLAAR